MSELDYSAAFAENEKEANLYAARCMRVLAVVVVVIWAMNLLRVFIVPPVIMAVAAVGGIVLFLLPTLLLRLLDQDSPRLKVCILLCCILGITLMSAALPKHAVMAWSAPIILGCHYYSKRFSYSLLAVSVIGMSVSLLIGVHVGEWDSNLLYALDTSGVREVTANTIRRVVLFYILPRSLILCGLSTICTTLSDRTRRLLERQIRDSAEKQQIASELSVATHIQTSMLPCIFPPFPERTEFDIYATMNPAKEVGGDFYDFFLVDDDHLAVVIADVSGKGVPAALFMVIAKTLIKDHTQQGTEPEEVFTEVNRLLCEANEEGMFVTAWMGVLELSTGHLAYVNAGHNPPLLRRNGKYEFLRTRSGFVLAGMDGMHYRPASLELVPGDTVYLYTDGVTEAANEEKQLYGDQRLCEVLNAHADSTPETLLKIVKDDVDAFAGDAPQFDDITMLSLRYLGREEQDSTHKEDR
ncbi:MAG: PP2C family protein-serine/threonine phosphatase [Ruminiclostridium sp.]|nr:PP2C family protein-serine/threonine phosphatase [Ruminiclostridium sp.]